MNLRGANNSKRLMKKIGYMASHAMHFCNFTNPLKSGAYAILIIRTRQIQIL